MAAPGWYHANGDPAGTVRYWDGSAWSGDPMVQNASAAPPTSDAFHGVLADPSQSVARDFAKPARPEIGRSKRRRGYPGWLKLVTLFYGAFQLLVVVLSASSYSLLTYASIAGILVVLSGPLQIFGALSEQPLVAMAGQAMWIAPAAIVAWAAWETQWGDVLINGESAPLWLAWVLTVLVVGQLGLFWRTSRVM